MRPEASTSTSPRRPPAPISDRRPPIRFTIRVADDQRAHSQARPSAPMAVRSRMRTGSPRWCLIFAFRSSASFRRKIRLVISAPDPKGWTVTAAANRRLRHTRLAGGTGRSMASSCGLRPKPTYRSCAVFTSRAAGTNWRPLADWTTCRSGPFSRASLRCNASITGRTMPRPSFTVLEKRGVPAGRLYIDRRADTLIVHDIALLPEWRGRGTGTALMQAICAEAARGRQKGQRGGREI